MHVMCSGELCNFCCLAPASADRTEVALRGRRGLINHFCCFSALRESSVASEM